MFQSTHSRGVRLDIMAGIRSEEVSIHALTRSATLLCFFPFVSPRLFQSTHSRGVRPGVVGPRCGKQTGFQSTHSRGVRLEQILFHKRFKCFNPRTHEECDRIYFFFFIFRYLEQGFREFF